MSSNVYLNGWTGEIPFGPLTQLDWEMLAFSYHDASKRMDEEMAEAERRGIKRGDLINFKLGRTARIGAYPNALMEQEGFNNV